MYEGSGRLKEALQMYEQQMRVERGENIIVGVNRFSDGQEPPSIPTPDYSALERGQVERVRAVRTARDAEAVRRALAVLGTASRGYVATTNDRAHLMPLIIDAVRARATVGEIADTLRDVWSEYRPT